MVVHIKGEGGAEKKSQFWLLGKPQKKQRQSKNDSSRSDIFLKHRTWRRRVVRP